MERLLGTEQQEKQYLQVTDYIKSSTKNIIIIFPRESGLSSRGAVGSNAVREISQVFIFAVDIMRVSLFPFAARRENEWSFNW